MSSWDHRKLGAIGLVLAIVLFLAINIFSAASIRNAQLDLTVDNITVAGMHNPIIGRSVIIHAKTDDGGQPTGNAGPRISMGVIGVAKNP